MRIKGVESLLYKIPVELQFGDRSIVLELDPIPYDFYSRLSRELQEPQPPINGFAKDSRGNVIKDDLGRAMPNYNTSDPEYSAKMAQVLHLQNVATIYNAMPASVEFSSNRDQFKDPVQFYSMIDEELRTFGFTAKHASVILRALRIDAGLIQDEKKSS